MKHFILIAVAGLLVTSVGLAACSNETGEPQTTGSVPQADNTAPPPALTSQPPATGEPPATQQ